jgi:hypothetical protein
MAMWRPYHASDCLGNLNLFQLQLGNLPAGIQTGYTGVKADIVLIVDLVSLA